MGPLAAEVVGAHATLRRWLFGHALPFWGRVGADGPALGFHEHLRLDGSPAFPPFKRMRVQARQLYVFSHAALLGWEPGLAVARHGYTFMLAHGRLGEGRWARTLARDGRVLDPVQDLYDLAFVIFGLAWFARASGDHAPLHEARRTMAWIETTMPAPHGGLHDEWPPRPGVRHQNPHMHLLEAALALQETSGDVGDARLVPALLALCRDRFLDPATGTLGEFFDERLRPAQGPAGDHVEPGHHYEWAWLLDQQARLAGTAPGPEMGRLYDFAEAHGVNRDGAVLDVVGRTGRTHRASTRLWPQTEAIKAHVAMLRQGRPAGRRLATSARVLADRHLVDCPPGTWRDHLDEGGRTIGDKIPASSFYHIVMAIGELDRLVAQGRGVPLYN